MRVVYLSLFVALMSSSAALASSPKEVARAKTSKWLWDRMHNQGLDEAKGEALVYLKDQADLSRSIQLQSKEAKGKFVHETLVRTAQESQSSLREWLTSNKINFDAHWIANLIVVKGASSEALDAIAARDDVLRVVGDPSVKNRIPTTSAFELFADQPTGVGQNITRIQADKVWAKGFTGKGIVIAGQDTGVQWDHPALKAHYRGWDGVKADHSYSWHDAIKTEIEGGSRCGYNKSEPCDDNDHGTHTIGSVVGDDAAGNQIGVAPGAQWIACRNMDAGVGRPSTYIDCFEWLLAPYKQGDSNFAGDPAKAPHVINNSWGCPVAEGCEGGEFESILKSLEAAGILVVVSAGNDGPSCSTIHDGPAFNTTNVFSVGAMDSVSNRIASFSSRGPSTFDNLVGPHVTAPGVNIRSSIPGSKYAQFGWSGTSMAGPHVVGAVALLWSAKPELIGNIAATREILMKSAQATREPSQTCGGVAGTAIPNNTWGFGTVDTLKSLDISL